MYCNRVSMVSIPDCVLCIINYAITANKKPNFSGSKTSLFICTAKLQKVIQTAKFFFKKLSTSFRFGKLFYIMKKLNS